MKKDTILLLITLFYLWHPIVIVAQDYSLQPVSITIENIELDVFIPEFELFNVTLDDGVTY